MNVWKTICALALTIWCGTAASAETNALSVPATNARPDYILAANDIVMVKVYQEDDLDAKVRISKDGSIVLPLLG